MGGIPLDIFETPNVALVFLGIPIPEYSQVIQTA